MTLLKKATIKQVLGEIPLTAEIYWQFRQPGRPLSKSASLRKLEKHLPAWRAQAQAAARRQPPGKRVMIFSTLRYWIEHAALMGVAMAGLGHQVSLAYLPYTNWRKPLNRFDLRRQNAYMRSVLRKAGPLVRAVSLLDTPSANALPEALEAEIREVSLRDAQYTLQVEEVDLNGELYRLRLARNFKAARAALAWMRKHRPDVVITPNGSILEMGAVYQAARYLGIPVVTYEFGEQRGRIWLARDAEVMRQDTGALWAARGGTPLTEEQTERVRALFASRQDASLWENFARRWQGVPSQGGTEARRSLGLDEPGPDARPLVVLAANVIGDSLTLGRQKFSRTMTEWLERTVAYFARRPDAQLVVRIHPGERYTKGPSVADVVRRALPGLDSDPSLAHIHLVAADDPVNTYDLVEIADLGLVYTTTVGMEMAMSGAPVVAAGETHYRGKGFTLDPESWEAYFELLERALAAPAEHRLSREQVDRAWNYAYRFFFEYPQPFPWHLLHFWKALEGDWTVEWVLSPEGQAEFGAAFRLLAGEPRDWSAQEQP